MDSRIIEVTQNMMRKLYKLGEDYESITCNVKKNAVEMVMSNGLVELKAKFPRSIIEDNIALIAKFPRSIFEDNIALMEGED